MAAPWLYLGPAAIAVAVISVACALWVAIAAVDREARRRLRFGSAMWLVAGALTLTLLQLVPLPLGFLTSVSPGTGEIYGVSGSAPISLDPPATSLAALQLATLLLAIVLGTMLFRHRERTRELLGVIGLYGALLTSVGVAELVLVHEEMPRYVAVAFENPNHFGAFVGFACFANAAVALGLRDNKRWVFIASAILCLIGTLLSSSRGAIGALLMVALAYGALTLARWSRWGAARWFTPVVLASAALGVWLLWTTIAEELRPDTAALTKIDVWRYTLPMLRDFALLGVGRGAFPQAFTRYDLTGAQLRFTHVENAPLQTLVDFGPVFGTLLVLGALFCIGKVVWAARQRADQAAAASALIFLAIHNLVDFNTALLAVALPATLLLTALDRGHSSSRGPDRPWLAGAAFASALALGVVSVPIVDARLGADTEAVRELSARGSEDAADALIWRHPADWVLPAIAAENQIKRGDLKQAMRHINRAMLLAPNCDVPHRLAGRALLAAGRRDQARLEYRLASRKVPREVQDIITEMLGHGEPLDDIPLLADNAPEIAVAVANVLMDRGAPRGALRALDETLASATIESEALDIAARASLATDDDALTQRLAAALEARDPKRSTPYLVRAARAEARGDVAAALAELDRGLQRARATHELNRRRIGLLTALGRYEEAHQAITWLLEHARGAADASGAHYYRGNLFMAEGRASDALTAYRKACDLAPRELEYRLAMVAAYERVGDRAAAVRELENARTELGDHMRIGSELTRLRRAKP